MSRAEIKQLVLAGAPHDGLSETGIKGVRLFRAQQAIPCVPAVYEPCVIAIVSGTKEAVLEGVKYSYDAQQYLCCPMAMPVKAGVCDATPENPLCGVLISLDVQVMAELSLEMENTNAASPYGAEPLRAQGIKLARWDDSFEDAMLRLLRLGTDNTDCAVLGPSRLREVYYAILKGEAGPFVRQAFGADNAIARSIAYVSTRLDRPLSIHDMASQAGMSRAVFHRRFKQVTTMAPLQFVKAMRLNTAALHIAAGVSIHQAALGVGYVSPSQFSRDFKRLYGQSPRQWGAAQHLPIGVA